MFESPLMLNDLEGGQQNHWALNVEYSNQTFHYVAVYVKILRYLTVNVWCCMKNNLISFIIMYIFLMNTFFFFFFKIFK